MNKILISRAPLHFSPQRSLFHLPSSLAPRSQSFLNSPLRRNSSYTSKTQTFCIATPSDSLGYGGWDDPQLGVDSVLSGESTQLQKILSSLGINDRKYIFVYLLGFFCALAVTRIRVSSLVAIPACVVVFAVGFSVGYVNGGHLSFSGIKRRPKYEVLRDSMEKLRNLVDLLGSIDANIVNLKNGIKKSIEKSRITVNDLEGVVKTAESIDLSALDAKSIIEGLIKSVLTESQEVEEKVNRKPSKRRKEVGENGFDLFRFIVGMFQDNSSGSNASKIKDLGKKGFEDAEVYDGKQKNMFVSAVEEQIPNTVLNSGGESRKGSLLGREANKASITWDNSENLLSNGRKMDVVPENWRMTGVHDVSEAAFGRKEYHYRNNQYLNNQQISLEMNYPNRVGTWDSRDASLDSMDFTVRLEHTESEMSFRRESEVMDWREKYMHPDHVEKGEIETMRTSVRGEREIQGEEPSPINQESAHDNDVVSPPPSIIREDTQFNSYLKEANMLLKKAKEVLVQQTNDRHVENALYQSAILLSKAIDIRPMSLLAVGQLGNTYLLHGELKLKTSRELRAMIAGRDPRSDKWGLNGLSDQLRTKDELISTLVNVCEECEGLLIKAGRTYRLALSIDGNDMRALYNWGLALSFRAQLIADIGPGTADDADKMFLAAIDKFDAMLSKSNVYAPDALFRWGAALQQRSRLRRWNSKEKVKLLQQARRFYEDALDMDSDNLQAEAALSSCISEMKFWSR